MGPTSSGVKNVVGIIVFAENEKKILDDFPLAQSSVEARRRLLTEKAIKPWIQVPGKVRVM